MQATTRVSVEQASKQPMWGQPIIIPRKTEATGETSEKRSRKVPPG
jgi:hypothetical protein